MLGPSLFVLSLLAILLVLICDMEGSPAGNHWISRIAVSLHKSRKTHLIVYGGCVSVLWSSFYLMAIELSSSVPWFETFLRDFSLSIWSLLLFMVITGVVIWNIWRFAPVETADGRLRDMNLVLEESADKSSSPLEGIEHVLNVVKTHAKDWDPRTIKSFLEYLARRDDQTGAEARRRLHELTNE